MSYRKALGALILIAGLSSLAAGAVSVEQMDRSVGDKVYCLCGCVAALNHCPHAECGYKTAMHTLIQKDAAEGKSEAAILQDLVQQFGERVLASPPPKGFNLTAWILPGLGLILGFIVTIAFVRRWQRPAIQSAAAPAPVDEKLRAKIEEEMRKITG